LPYVEADAVYHAYDFNERNLSPANQGAVCNPIGVFVCPSDDALGRRGSSYARSNYVVCFGSNSMIMAPGDVSTDGAFQIDAPRGFRDFRDGTSWTVLASEVIAGKHDAVGADRTWDARGLWAWHITGASAYTHRNTPNSSAGDALWVNPGQDIQCVPAVRMPCDNTHGTAWHEFHSAARSWHASGVNVAFADGHIGFVKDAISLTIWKALATIAGSEIVTEY
jgi:prepilin-type processing-associated H-X9-DG protein